MLFKKAKPNRVTVDLLPNELTANILARLPLKDILSSKGVCKTWCTLIRGPYFTRIYVKNSHFTTLFLAQTQNKHCLSLSMFEFAENGEFSQMAIKPKLPYPHGVDLDMSLNVIGSCDCSIFLLSTKPYKARTYYRVYSFNPVLGLCVRVSEDKNTNPSLEYKVGYIPCSNTYKLIRFVVCQRNKVEEAEILTVGLDKKWRAVDADSMNSCYGRSKQVICLNGAQHWVSEEYDDMICTFDLLEEKRGAGILNPPGVSWRSARRMVFVNNNKGCLTVAVWSGEQPNSKTIMWTMKEYGVEESWSKEFVLSDHRLFPTAVLSNRNILFYEHGGGNREKAVLVLYGLEKKRLDRIMVSECLCSPPLALYVNTYVPRLALQ